MKINKDRNKCYLAYYSMCNNVSKTYVLRIAAVEYTKINKMSTIDNNI